MERCFLERRGVGGVLFLRRRVTLLSTRRQGCPRDYQFLTFLRLRAQKSLIHLGVPDFDIFARPVI